MEKQSGVPGQAKESPTSASLQKELLWGDYVELLTMARHVETVRTNAMNLMLVMMSGLTALITFDGVIDLSDLMPSLIIAVTGVFSTVFSLAYLARYNKNKRRAGFVRAELDRRFFPDELQRPGLTKLRKEADLATVESEFKGRRARRYYLVLSAANRATGTTHMFWVVVPMFVSLIGIVLTVFSLVGVQATQA